MEGNSLGVHVDDCSMIIIFDNEQLFHGAVEANPHLKYLVGKSEHDRQLVPGVYIAGVIKKDSEADLLWSS